MTTTKSTGRRVFACRVAVETPAIIEEIAKSYGCMRVDQQGDLVGAAGVLMDRIADGRLLVVPAPIDDD